MSADWIQGPWADVIDGDTVLGADGHEWEAERRGQRITLRREGRRPVTATPDPARAVRYRRGAWGHELAGAVAVLRGAGFEPELIESRPLKWLGGGGRRR